MLQHTFTVFADGDDPSLAESLARIINKEPQGKVKIADNLDAAFDSTSEVLVLHLSQRREERLSAELLASLKRRKIIVMGLNLGWLCIELDLEIGDGCITPNVPLQLADSTLLGNLTSNDNLASNFPIMPFTEAKPYHPLWSVDKDPSVFWGNVPDELKPLVDVVAHCATDEKLPVLFRQANFVIAGVGGHPGRVVSGVPRSFPSGCASACRVRGGRPVPD